MSPVSKLHELIEKLTHDNDGEPIDRGDLRDAAEMFDLFPARRFRQAFYDALARLEKEEIIEREGDAITLLQTVKVTRGWKP